MLLRQLPMNSILLIIMVFKGRIHQIEYAMEAVKQGSATVALKSKTHAVIVALKVGCLYPAYVLCMYSRIMSVLCMLQKMNIFTVSLLCL